MGAGKIYILLTRAVSQDGLSNAQAEEIIGLPIPLKYPSDTASVILKGTASELVSLAPRLKESERCFSVDFGYTLMRIPEGMQAMTLPRGLFPSLHTLVFRHREAIYDN